MTYVPRRRRPATRRPKDILVLALRNLWAGDELICTPRTHRNIKDRIDVWSKSQPERRIAIIHAAPITKIRRVA
jgi:hypothetical protein